MSELTPLTSQQRLSLLQQIRQHPNAERVAGYELGPEVSGTIQGHLESSVADDVDLFVMNPADVQPVDTNNYRSRLVVTTDPGETGEAPQILGIVTPNMLFDDNETAGLDTMAFAWDEEGALSAYMNLDGLDVVQSTHMPYSVVPDPSPELLREDNLLFWNKTPQVEGDTRELGRLNLETKASNDIEALLQNVLSQPGQQVLTQDGQTAGNVVEVTRSAIDTSNEAYLHLLEAPDFKAHLAEERGVVLGDALSSLEGLSLDPEASVKVFPVEAVTMSDRGVDENTHYVIQHQDGSWRIVEPYLNFIDSTGNGSIDSLRYVSSDPVYGESEANRPAESEAEYHSTQVFNLSLLDGATTTYTIKTRLPVPELDSLVNPDAR